MPNKVLYRWKRGVGMLLAASMLLSGCTAAGVMPAAVDAVSSESSVQTGPSSVKQTEEIGSLALLWTVDEEHTLPRTYVPEDLTDIGNGLRLAKEAAEAYINLQRSLDIDGGEKLRPVAGYCSWEEQEERLEKQKQLYLEQGYEEAKAATFAAYDCGALGSDPFQTGLYLRIETPQPETEEWLAENAGEYGFILYEEENAQVLRYIGRLYAAAAEQLGVDFEGYMKYLHTYKSCVVILDSVAYTVEMIDDLSLLSGSFLEIYSDNQGAYVVVRTQEE